MTLTGNDADEFIAQPRDRNAKVRAEALTKAKAEAAKAGKERFDLNKLEALADTSREGTLDPVDERRTRFEAI